MRPLNSVVRRLQNLHTYPIQLLLHFQSVKENDDRFDGFLAELRELAARHGISYDDFQSMCLRSQDFRIENCTNCTQLTVRKSDLDPEMEVMLPDFWFFVRRGTESGAGLLCDNCRIQGQSV